jgi:alpha-tubulin suppressor-like RCC1 family protein
VLAPRNLLVSICVAWSLSACRQILDIDDRSVACDDACADARTRLRCTESGDRVAEACPVSVPICDGGRCVQCAASSDCPAPDAVCMQPSCTDQVCGIDPVPSGQRAPDQTPGDCQGLECNGHGMGTVIVDRYDTGDDFNACTAELCSDSGPTVQTLDGATCGEGTCAGQVCLGRRLSMDSSFHHSCLVTDDGVVFCWGANESGQIGDGTIENRSIPTRVPRIGPGGLGAAVQVSVSHANTCVLLEGGQVACWGNDLAGQVGNRTSAAAVLEPTLVEGVTATQIATGWGHTCALTEAGEVLCWGACLSGECGTPDVAGSILLEPTPVQGIADVRLVVTTSHHTCALVGGDVYCWGENRYGQLGRGTVSEDPNPVPERVLGLPPAVVLAVSWSTTCAVTAAGTVWCWGDNQRGQLGADPDPDTPEWESSSVPVPVTDPDHPTDGVLGAVSQVFAGAGSHLCATGSWRGREPLCWGGSEFGEIPIDGSTTLFETVVPRRTAFDPDTSVLALGENFSCAVVRLPGERPDIQCSGDNAFGETGTGTFDTQLGLPTSLAWPR